MEIMLQILEQKFSILKALELKLFRTFTYMKKAYKIKIAQLILFNK